MVGLVLSDVGLAEVTSGSRSFPTCTKLSFTKKSQTRKAKQQDAD